MSNEGRASFHLNFCLLPFSKGPVVTARDVVAYAAREVYRLATAKPTGENESPLRHL
jgi:hypothetical protein